MTSAVRVWSVLGGSAWSSCWCLVEGDKLRSRETQIMSCEKPSHVIMVDHGQVMSYIGSNSARAAESGVFRVGTHAQYEFGESRVRLPGTDRTGTSRGRRWK